MTKVRRTVTISTELDEAISMLTVSKNMNYSEFLESRLRMVPIIQKMIEHLERLPEIPDMDVTKLNDKSKTQVIV